MKLIAEEIVEVNFLTEDNNGKTSHFIEGVFLQGEIKNRNGRMYPIDTLQREVDTYNESYVSKGRALGELGHPDGPQINLDRVSHKIVSLRQEGNNFIGKAKILETPMGKIAKNVVKDDFMLATAADIVADPSAPDAFVECIMEGKDWIWNSGSWRESDIATAKREIDNANVDQLTEKKLKAFESLLRNLKF